MVVLEEWRPLRNFPGYKISSHGEVFSEKYNRCLIPQVVHNGTLTVTLHVQSRQYHRSLSLLIAKTFLDPPPRSDFITPVHLDGNKQNCYVDNLVWRPRWFANEFHRERVIEPFPNWDAVFKNIDTDQIFYHPNECAIRYGVLERQVYLSMVNYTPVFPHGHMYRFLPD